MLIFCKLTLACVSCDCDCDNLKLRVRESIWLGGRSSFGGIMDGHAWT